MAKKPFINKHGFVEYPFLHDTRKQKNWWFYNLMEDYLKRRARQNVGPNYTCLLYTSPSPRDRTRSRMPSSA